MELPGKGKELPLFWGPRALLQLSCTNHIPTASQTQTALAETGSSAPWPGGPPRTWRGYQSTCAGPASTSQTRSTEVGYRSSQGSLGGSRPWSGAERQGGAVLLAAALPIEPAPLSTYPTSSQPGLPRPPSAVSVANGYSQASSMWPFPASFSVTASLRSDTHTTHFIYPRAFFAPNISTCNIWADEGKNICAF